MPSSCCFVIYSMILYLGLFINPYTHAHSLIHIFASTRLNTYNLPIFKDKHKGMICQIFPHIYLKLDHFGMKCYLKHISVTIYQLVAIFSQILTCMGPSLGSIGLPSCCEDIVNVCWFFYLFICHFVFRTSSLLWLFPKFGHILQNSKLNVSHPPLKKKNTGEITSILFQDRYQSEGNIAKFTKQCMHYQFFLPNHFFEQWWVVYRYFNPPMNTNIKAFNTRVMVSGKKKE